MLTRVRAKKRERTSSVLETPAIVPRATGSVDFETLDLTRSTPAKTHVEPEVKKAKRAGDEKEAFSTPAIVPRAAATSIDFDELDLMRDTPSTATAGVPVKAAKVQKKKKKEGKRSASTMFRDEEGRRRWRCDRCGRKDFISGHALGGHRKYCAKPRYQHAQKLRTKTLKRMHLREIAEEAKSTPPADDVRRTDSPRLDFDLQMEWVSVPLETGHHSPSPKFDLRDWCASSSDLSMPCDFSFGFGMPIKTSFSQNIANQLDWASRSCSLDELQEIQSLLRTEYGRIAGIVASMENALA